MAGLEISEGHVGLATLVRGSAVVAVDLGARPLIAGSHQGPEARETRAHEIGAWLDDGVREQIWGVPGRV